MYLTNSESGNRDEENCINFCDRILIKRKAQVE